jgi:hypothetical protein
LSPEEIEELRASLMRVREFIKESLEQGRQEFSRLTIDQHIMAAEAARERHDALLYELLETKVAYSAGPQTKKRQAEEHLKAIAVMVELLERDEPELTNSMRVHLANVAYGKVMMRTKAGGPFYQDEKRLRRRVRELRAHRDRDSNGS